VTETELFDLCVDSGCPETAALAIVRELVPFIASDALLIETAEAADMALGAAETVLQAVKYARENLDEIHAETTAAVGQLSAALKAADL
jgi:hypothetical protein